MENKSYEIYARTIDLSDEWFMPNVLKVGEATTYQDALDIREGVSGVLNCKCYIVKVIRENI